MISECQKEGSLMQAIKIEEDGVDKQQSHSYEVLGCERPHSIEHLIQMRIF